MSTSKDRLSMTSEEFNRMLNEALAAKMAEHEKQMAEVMADLTTTKERLVKAEAIKARAGRKIDANSLDGFDGLLGLAIAGGMVPSFANWHEYGTYYQKFSGSRTTAKNDQVMGGNTRRHTAAFAEWGSFDDEGRYTINSDFLELLLASEPVASEPAASEPVASE